MKEQSFLSFLIFCTVFSQGIAALTDESFENSTDLHIRKKRVIDRTEYGHMPARSLTRVRSIVNILRNGIPHCAGAILEANVILTSRTCIYGDFHRFSVLSGSTDKHEGTHHNITHRAFVSTVNHLVIFQIFPPINLHGINSRIEPLVGEIPPESYVTFAGWGCTGRDHEGNGIFPNELMITRLTLIHLDECSHAFIDDDIEIGQRTICTLDRTRRRGACDGDQGGPLIYHNQLVGILHYPGKELGVTPDRFINVNEHDQRQFIILMRNSLMH